MTQWWGQHEGGLGSKEGYKGEEGRQVVSAEACVQLGVGGGKDWRMFLNSQEGANKKGEVKGTRKRRDDGCSKVLGEVGGDRIQSRAGRTGSSYQNAPLTRIVRALSNIKSNFGDEDAGI